MQDFFTELDSDILGSDKTSEHFKKPPMEQKPIPRFTPPPENHQRKNPPIKHPPREKAISIIRDNGNIPAHVSEMRTQMMHAGVVAIVFRTDEKSRALLGHLKIETRGFVYSDDIRDVHKAIIKKARASYENTVKDVPDIEEKELIKIIRRDLEIFLQHKTEKNPVIIPIIVSI